MEKLFISDLHKILFNSFINFAFATKQIQLIHYLSIIKQAILNYFRTLSEPHASSV